MEIKNYYVMGNHMPVKVIINNNKIIITNNLASWLHVNAMVIPLRPDYKNN